MARNNYLEWSREEIEQLIRLYESKVERKLSWNDIAAIMGRSKESCRSKARYLTLTKGRPRDWNRRTDIVEDVADLMIFDYGRNEIARELGVSTTAVNNAIKRQDARSVSAWKARRSTS